MRLWCTICGYLNIEQFVDFSSTILCAHRGFHIPYPIKIGALTIELASFLWRFRCQPPSNVLCIYLLLLLLLLLPPVLLSSPKHKCQKTQGNRRDAFPALRLQCDVLLYITIHPFVTNTSRDVMWCV